MDVSFDNGKGLRPDGRVVGWWLNVLDLPLQDHVFIEAIGGYQNGCGLSVEHKVYCWRLGQPVQELQGDLARNPFIPEGQPKPGSAKHQNLTVIQTGA